MRTWINIESHHICHSRYTPHLINNDVIILALAGECRQRYKYNTGSNSCKLHETESSAFSHCRHEKGHLGGMATIGDPTNMP